MDLNEQIRAGGAVILCPTGRIDHRTANAFKDALSPFVERCAQGLGNVVLDLSETEYMSSVGLRVLMVAARQVKTSDGKMVLCGLQPLMNEIMTISRFDLIFDIYGTVDEALAAVTAN
ncbi:MAG: anti-sigma B factor antagonist [Gammaproteobacteria bacterium]|jgi:anti-sigma B factor antagonist